MRDLTGLDSGALSHEVILRALFENYECIYYVDVDTNAYRCCHESVPYSDLRIALGGKDFFSDMLSEVDRTVYEEDREYVKHALSKEEMLEGIRREEYYSVVYRLMIDGKPTYHKIRAAMGDVEGKRHILIGIRNVEETIRREKEHEKSLESMHQKEKNHLEAVLAASAGYLEANLTRDLLIEKSPSFTSSEGVPMISIYAYASEKLYSGLQRLICSKVVFGAEAYERTGAAEYLISRFAQGDKRVSVSFSLRMDNGSVRNCSEVFFLYRDSVSGDVMAFCVIYDLTEQRRREKELQELENELKLSRIRNSTSQMQPHFLYNALGSIQEILLDDPKYASELIGDFAIHLRSCIRAMGSDAPLPFGQEISNIKAYVRIEQMRFGKKLKVVYDTPVTDFLIVPLSVQPLVENAIRHGIYERASAGGTVTVRSRETESEWIVEVEDDGVGFDVSELGAAAWARKGSTGIENISFRLEKVMNASVDIKSVRGVGTKATIRLPKKGESNESDNS